MRCGAGSGPIRDDGPTGRGSGPVRWPSAGSVRCDPCRCGRRRPRRWSPERSGRATHTPGRVRSGWFGMVLEPPRPAVDASRPRPRPPRRRGRRRTAVGRRHETPRPTRPGLAEEGDGRRPERGPGRGASSPFAPTARLMAIARARSADMATNDDFSHTQPDGRNVFDILWAQGSPGTKRARSSPGTTTRWTRDQRRKPPMGGFARPPRDHRLDRLQLRRRRTRGGRRAGKKIWTAVFIKGPDRTGARALLASGTPSRPTVKFRLRDSHLGRDAGPSWKGGFVPLTELVDVLEHRLTPGWSSVVTPSSSTRPTRPRRWRASAS